MIPAPRTPAMLIANPLAPLGLLASGFLDSVELLAPMVMEAEGVGVADAAPEAEAEAVAEALAEEAAELLDWLEDC
jgi:hypothetical protein